MGLKTQEQPIPLFTAIATYCCYALLIFFGRVRDIYQSFFGKNKGLPPPGYAPLLNDWEDFYTRHLYRRIHDCYNRPITSCPGSWIDVMERNMIDYQKPLIHTGKALRCLNLGSYNYLGFGDPNSPTRAAVFAALEKFSVSTTSPRPSLGTTSLHVKLESTVARFVGKEDAMVFGMGFGTNSLGIPALVGKGCLLISDSLNHSSIVAGARTSGAVIQVFNHNDTRDLERVIRKAICDGQPRTHRPWKKILVVIEGIYSMEGEFCVLPDIVAIKKKYKCYLYLDEAHSIGAVGRRGRGVCDHFGVDPKDVDIMMGTFTKSFGAVGGYLAADKSIISYLRTQCAGYAYSSSISPPAAQQVISALQIIMGEDGTDLGKRKMAALRDNSNFFRHELRKLGCHVLGDWDSPIIPLMLYHPTKIPAFSRMCLEKNLAVVVVGYPAAPLLYPRTRFCISAGHSKEDLKNALEAVSKIAWHCGLMYGDPDMTPIPKESS